MSGKRAKQIRKLIYGENLSPRYREYKRNPGTNEIRADGRRQLYQRTKKL